jgi:hypothetical protein
MTVGGTEAKLSLSSRKAATCMAKETNQFWRKKRGEDACLIRNECVHIIIEVNKQNIILPNGGSQ